jgi:hypothetical protein
MVIDHWLWLLVMDIACGYGYWLWLLLVAMVIDHWLLAIDFYTKAIMAKVIACDFVYCYGHWLFAIAFGHWLLFWLLITSNSLCLLVITFNHWLLVAFSYWLLPLVIALGY